MNFSKNSKLPSRLSWMKGACAGLIVAIVAGVGSASVMADETGMATIHDWRTERGKVCLVGHFHTGAGEGRTKRKAKRAAIKAWQEFTAWEYGTTWARFRRAANKTIGYTRTAGGWEASVEARACKRRSRRSRRRRR